MKQTAMVLCLLMSAAFGLAQENNSKRITEYYLTPLSFDRLSFSLKYKRQLKQNKFIKIGLIDLGGYLQNFKPNSSGLFPANTFQYSAGFQVGIEKRKTLNDRFSLFHGPNIGASYRHFQSELLDPALPVSDRKTISRQQVVSLNYTIGALLNVTDRILLAAEVNPGLYYTFTYDKVLINQSGRNASISGGLSTNFVQLSLAYRL